VKKTQSNVERATFGDLDVFSQLKDQLATDAPKPPAPKPPKAKEAPVVEKAPAKEEAKAPAKEEVKAEAPAPVKEEPKAKAAPKAKKAKADSGQDDFKKIEGIGPKISQLIVDAGIPTFAELANTPAEKIKEILAEAGSRYRMHDPTTWPAQAKMAAEGDWDGLKKWQDELDGGK